MGNCASGTGGAQALSLEDAPSALLECFFVVCSERPICAARDLCAVAMASKRLHASSVACGSLMWCRAAGLAAPAKAFRLASEVPPNQWRYHSYPYNGDFLIANARPKGYGTEPERLAAVAAGAAEAASALELLRRLKPIGVASRWSDEDHSGEWGSLGEVAALNATRVDGDRVTVFASHGGKYGQCVVASTRLIEYAGGCFTILCDVNMSLSEFSGDGCDEVYPAVDGLAEALLPVGSSLSTAKLLGVLAASAFQVWGAGHRNIFDAHEAFSLAGAYDEYFANPRRRKLESSTSAAPASVVPKYFSNNKPEFEQAVRRLVRDARDAP